MVSSSAAMRFLQSATLSRHGDTVAYVLRVTDADRDDDVYELWTCGSDGTDARRWIESEQGLGRPEWSPTRDVIACLGRPDGKDGDIALIDVGASDVSVVACRDLLPTQAVWHPGGGTLTVAARRAAPADPAAPFRVKTQPWRLEGVGRVAEAFTDFYDVMPGGGSERIAVPYDAVRFRMTWSPDGRYLAFLEAFRADLQTSAFNSPLAALCVWDAHTGTTLRCTTEDWGWVLPFAWTPDSTQLVFLGICLTGRAISRFAAPPDLWAYEPASAALEQLPLPAVEQYGVRLQADMPADLDSLFNQIVAGPGADLLVPGQLGGRAAVWRVSPEAGSAAVVSPDEDASYALVGLLEDGSTVVAARTTPTEPPELYAFSLGGGDVRELSSFNPSRGASRGEVLRRRVAVAPGHAIDAWVHVPLGKEPPYPTLLKVHGGPYGATGEIFNLDVQQLVDRGYCVIEHNFRGSYGYGEAFATSITDDWGRIGEADHLAAVNHEVEAGLADRERIGVFGLSHGGFAACWLATRGGPFKAAVAENPVTNFVSQWGSSDASSWFMPFEMEGKTPYDDLTAYLERSPVSFVQDCRVPVLLVQGLKDSRCPPEQTFQFFLGLKWHHQVAEMLLLPESDHLGSILGPARYRRARLQAVQDWFDEHLSR